MSFCSRDIQTFFYFLVFLNNPLMFSGMFCQEPHCLGKQKTSAGRWGAQICVRNLPKEVKEDEDLRKKFEGAPSLRASRANFSFRCFGTGKCVVVYPLCAVLVLVFLLCDGSWCLWVVSKWIKYYCDLFVLSSFIKSFDCWLLLMLFWGSTEHTVAWFMDLVCGCICNCLWAIHGYP